MLNKDFKEFVGLLNSTGVEYLVVGGYALAAFGQPRYTGDIDIWVRSTEANAAALLKALDASASAPRDSLRPTSLRPSRCCNSVTRRRESTC